MRGFPLHISLIAEAHRDRGSKYVFEDRLFAAPAIIAYDFAVALQKPLHRIYYSDDQHPKVEIERKSEPFGKLSAAIMGCALIKLSISRGWTTGGCGGPSTGRSRSSNWRMMRKPLHGSIAQHTT